MTTASYRTEGPPSIFWWAGTSCPSLVTTPPICGSDEFDECSFSGCRLAQRCQQCRIGAVGDECANLAAGEAVRPVEQDAQRR